jgi:hypothetical protein
VAVGVRARAAAAVGGAQEVRADVRARVVARLRALDEVLAARRTRFFDARTVMPRSPASCSCERPSTSRRSRTSRWRSGSAATSAERGAQLLAAGDDGVRVGVALGGGGARVELVARDGLRAGGAGTAQLVQRAVADQAVEPGPDRELAVVLAHRPVGLGEDLLDDVLGPGVRSPITRAA